MEFLTPTTRAWFEANFEAPTPVQVRGWAAIESGAHTLLVAPTGSGKTLAAFLAGLDRLGRLPRDAEPGCRIVYVSPLKALVHDVEKNLRVPLSGLALAAERAGAPLRPIRVDVRTGDTPAKERQRQSRDPGDVLVTTPESLYLILGSRQRETLRSVTTVIVDEIHALVPTKRGAHLALSLERLAELCETDPQRIGLSATARPLEDVARFLGGDRAVEIVDTSERPNIDVEIHVPVPDMANPPVRPPVPSTAERGGGSSHMMGVLPGNLNSQPSNERGLWPSIYPELLAAIRAHRSTILFVNSRGLAERLSQRLNELAGEELVLAHHGSVSHGKRAETEEALKSGRLRGIVATSSLELGIDMGAVDLVVLVESPGSVARGLQRVGRAGHHVGAVSRGRFFPKFRGDLLECAVVVEHMQRGAIEAVAMPANCLDVLAQQLVAACVERPREVDQLFTLVLRAAPYAELTKGAFRSVLDMLSGRYPGGEFADLRPRLAWDRAADVLTARRGAELVMRVGAGTIPDRGAFPVHLGEDGPRVGELDEEMVYESREGDLFLLGASTWRVEGIAKDRVVVSPAPGEPGRLPFWHGDGPGRPVELGRALGAFVREYGALDRDAAAQRLAAELPLTELAARNLAAYLADQREHTGHLPTDRAITVERFRDELGDWRVCILSPFGSRVHAPWAIAIQNRLAAASDVEAQVFHTDDGIVLRLADTGELPSLATLLPEPEELDELVTDGLSGTALFASLFRENAVRSLLMTRRRPGERAPLWAQRIKARALLATVQRYPSFPIVLETYRQALSDVFDLPGLRELLGAIRSREVRVDEVETASPSPFAKNLVFAYTAQYLYDGDSPLAERRAQALTLDREMLRGLIGEAELRELLDEDVMRVLEEELQGLATERRARDKDELCDLLRRTGELSSAEAFERCAEDPRPWFTELGREQRAAAVHVAGEERWIAAEEAGLYRDALGCVPPGGLPADCLTPADDPLGPLGVLARRFARRRGPFETADFARRYALLPAQVEPLLHGLEQEGVLVRGELRPGGSASTGGLASEWCDAEVLRRIKRRTLAKLRGEVAAVAPEVLGRFLPRWQGVGPAEPRGDARLDEVVRQLEGLALPWSELALELLPARIPGFTIDALDLAAAQGRVVWLGRGASGPRDGRVALYRREAAPLLAVAGELEEAGPLHLALRAVLEERGACFLTELERAVRERQGEVPRAELEQALWDLVWAGELTNDTFGPLRALTARGARGRRGARSAVLSGGRWSLARDLVDVGVTETERAVARARNLLERYGIVSREAAQADELPGGFAAVYGVLRSMEEAGQVRRGYFVEGLSGAQFAAPGAVDRLRAKHAQGEGESSVQILSALDPANPWGALVSWPARRREEGPGPRRSAGSRIVLVGGRPVLWVPASGRKLVTFGPPPGSPPESEQAELDESLVLALAALARAPRRGRRRSLVIESLDGLAAEDSPLRGALERAGWRRDYRGFMADPYAQEPPPSSAPGAR